MRVFLQGFVVAASIGSAAAHAMSATVAMEFARPGYDARETAPGGFVLNHEHGRLGDAALSLQLEGDTGAWTVLGSSARGTVRYRGFSQLGVPLSTSTKLQLDAAELRWSPPWSVRVAGFLVQPRAGLSSRRIDRAVQASAQSTPLTETLDATRLHVAMVVTHPLGERWQLQAEADYARPLRQRLSVETAGVYDDFTMHPHAGHALDFAFGVEWQLAMHWTLGLRLEHQQLAFGTDGPVDVRREGVIVGSANYPGSRQHLGGAKLRVGYRF